VQYWIKYVSHWTHAKRNNIPLHLKFTAVIARNPTLTHSTNVQYKKVKYWLKRILIENTIFCSEEPLSKDKDKPEDEDVENADEDSSLSGNGSSSADTVPVIAGSQGEIQWQLGTPMPDARARACAVTTDSDTIYVLGV